jgi:hypothetical protein
MSKATITLHLIHGEPIAFKVEMDDARSRNAASNIERSMDSNYIGVELNGKLVIVPIHNIRTIEISPAPAVKIAHVVQGAQPL